MKVLSALRLVSMLVWIFAQKNVQRSENIISQQAVIEPQKFGMFKQVNESKVFPKAMHFLLRISCFFRTEKAMLQTTR